jgi:hypothetical protein
LAVIPEESSKRLRGLLAAVIIVDLAITLYGQPRGPLVKPGSYDEMNPVFAWFLAKGWLSFAAMSVVYIVSVIMLVSALPGPSGSVVLFSFMFAHYFGACTWLAFHFHLGMGAVIVYGVAISLAVVRLGKPPEMEILA